MDDINLLSMICHMTMWTSELPANKKPSTVIATDSALIAAVLKYKQNTEAKRKKISL